MGILETVSKNKEKEAEKKGEYKTPPPQGHALAQILQDKQKSDLFGELLKKEGKMDLAQRIADGKLEQSDIDLLEEKRVLFSEKITVSEKVEKWLTKDNVILLARNHPEFAKLVNLATPEKAIRAIQNRLKEISITDEARFGDIVSAMDTLESYKNKDYKELNDEVEKFLTEKGISSKEYSDVLAMESGVKKDQAMKEMASKYGNRWFNRVDAALLLRLQNTETSIDDAIKELGVHQNAIAGALFASVHGNESMRSSFFGELLNEKPSEKPEMGFKEARQGTFNDEKFKADWIVKKKKEKYKIKNPKEKEAIRQSFIEEQKDVYRERNENKGFWVSVFETFWEHNIEEKESELT